jgi:hypothetical protein
MTYREVPAIERIVGALVALRIRNIDVEVEGSSPASDEQLAEYLSTQRGYPRWVLYSDAKTQEERDALLRAVVGLAARLLEAGMPASGLSEAAASAARKAGQEKVGLAAAKAVAPFGGHVFLRDEKKSPPGGSGGFGGGGGGFGRQAQAQTSAPAAPSGDPLARLQRAKEMLTAGLIDQDEYDALKARVLSEM